MKTALKEMKNICPNLKEDKTEIVVRSSEIDPYYPEEYVKLTTRINGIYVNMVNNLKKDKQNEKV
jgi:hypothetical protein